LKRLNNQVVPRLVFATNNVHKLEEVRRIAAGKIEVLSLADIHCHDEIPETADTLAGNAMQKARWVKDKYGYDCFADDTGLMVDTLHGAPGVYTARYAGEHCTPADNVAKLLRVMQGEKNRNARFVTAIALIIGNQVYEMEGTVHGRITEECRGTDGFGYDPVFIADETDGKTFAEVGPDVKNTISHRARAIEQLMKTLDTVQQGINDKD